VGGVHCEGRTPIGDATSAELKGPPPAPICARARACHLSSDRSKLTYARAAEMRRIVAEGDDRAG
jgi:hypothetical protein